MDAAGQAGRADRRTSRRLAGDEAEEAAARHLTSAGWTILARNLRVGRSELDILARDPGAPWALVIVEVRSRSGPRFGAPVESVGRAKVERLYEAAWRLQRAGGLPHGPRLPPATWRVDLLTLEREGVSDPWRITRHVRGVAPP
jgi:putative endonuclease